MRELGKSLSGILDLGSSCPKVVEKQELHEVIWELQVEGSDGRPCLPCKEPALGCGGKKEKWSQSRSC